MDYEFPKPPRSLVGKVAIVTGAGAHGDGIGNGRAIAILLAEDGCAVVCVDRDVALAQRTVEMIEGERGSGSGSGSNNNSSSGGGGGSGSGNFSGSTSTSTSSNNNPGPILQSEADSGPSLQSEADSGPSLPSEAEADIESGQPPPANHAAAVTTTATSTSTVAVPIAVAMAGDVSVEADCKSIVDSTLQQFGRLDILVNCVGIGGAAGTAVDVDMAAWTASMHINVGSMVMMAKYAVPAMRRNAIEPNWLYRGAIVNMGSVAGLKGGTPHLLYPTAKGAVVNMTRAMAAHHAADAIRVNCVCPGMVYTPMMYAGGRTMSEETRTARKNRSLLKTEGTGWDVACAVRFLAGPQARWITGVILPVDAGVTAAVGTDIPKSASVNG
ncbi:hypothetical protein A1O3_01705 [Capronia epimyces CBS 606.96]|uniref:3-oxoacyl-[acyl-carrier protein] reductase n=1 Tax=Capronia epimyces CBS 606.96 TaxID=1182542 RepID=W9YKQ4_9EURO|nr:uncharacterized protein A1O3_01705 [Capronia epimyces CBS 606.96]EXJ93148.1 hypothetical protein A1O3_01705 [Capronia epimyces CBS 606.96]